MLAFMYTNCDCWGFRGLSRGATVHDKPEWQALIGIASCTLRFCST